MKKFALPIILVVIASCVEPDKKKEEAIEPSVLLATEIQNKSLDELRILRNEIFARKGYIFESKDLLKHFSTFDWYEPKYKKVDSLLSETDRINVQTILKLEKRKKSEYERRKIKISESELSQYRNAYDSAGKWDKQFISRLFQTIDQFSERIADTTILTIGNIDGIGEPDTISNHIYAIDNTIHVESSWYRRGLLLWSDTLKNPYLGINNDDIFSYDQRHPWVTFTVGIYYCVAELSKRADYTEIDRKTALKMAQGYISKKHLPISEKEYVQYFDSFKGQLFIFGEPEIRHEILQWYEPEKEFILYYAP